MSSIFGIFTGVIVNAVLVVVGTLVGLIAKGEKAAQVGERIFQAFAVFIVMLGINGAKDLSSPVLILSFIIVGVAIGELIDIDDKFNRLGSFLQSKFSGKEDARFSEGFISASLLFCIGSMTIMGALQSGIENEHSIYIAKGVIDAISALSMAMGSGIGVAFSALSVLAYQGLLTAGASILAPVLSAESIALSTTIGSLSLIVVGLNVLKITKIKVANFLPAMFMPFIWNGILQAINALIY